MEIIPIDSPMFEEIGKKASIIKIILLGNEKSGKSIFLARFCNANYDKFLKMTILPTIGMEFKEILCKLNCDYYKLQIWDTSGGEVYKTLITMMSKAEDIIIIFYDSLTTKNFNDLKKNCDEIKLNNKKQIIGIVRNKYELDNDAYSNLGVVQNISEEEIIEFADKNKIIYGHVSPMLKYGTGIREYLAKIIQEYKKL